MKLDTFKQIRQYRDKSNDSSFGHKHSWTYIHEERKENLPKRHAPHLLHPFTSKQGAGNEQHINHPSFSSPPQGPDGPPGKIGFPGPQVKALGYSFTFPFLPLIYYWCLCSSGEASHQLDLEDVHDTSNVCRPYRTGFKYIQTK